MDESVFTETDVVLSTLAAAVICWLLIPRLSIVARQLGLVDKPTGRKVHVGDVPLVGGLCIYLSAFLAIGLVHFSSVPLLPLSVGAALIVLGVLDDRYGLSTLVRFPVQVAVALLMIVVGGVSIETIGDLTGQGALVMGTLMSTAFTVVCTVGVINSINMIDGVDGLSASIIGLTVATLAYFSHLAGDMASVALLLALLAGNLVFLVMHNARFRLVKANVFMGDAGSTLFGFILVWYFIQLTQGENAILSPVAAGWIFGLPLIDTVAVMVGRIIGRRSPFDADRNHLHHRLLDAGASVNQTVILMAAIHAALIAIGLLCNVASSATEPFFFWLFVALVIFHFFFTQHLLDTLKRIGFVRLSNEP